MKHGEFKSQGPLKKINTKNGNDFEVLKNILSLQNANVKTKFIVI